jgi:hypothetical protein
MSGWHSLQSVSSLHILLQAVGCLVAVFVIAAGITAYHYWSRWSDLVAIADRARNRYLPRWRIDTSAALHNAFAEIAILGTAALLALGYGSFSYGQRKAELVVESHAAEITTQVAKVRAEADDLQRVNAQAATGHAAQVSAQIAKVRAEADALHRASTQAAATRHTAEIVELQQRLRQTESRRVASVESLRWEVKQTEARGEATISRLERQLAQVERRLATLTQQRRLTANEKDSMVEALRPYAGQKVTIAAIAGDDDDKVYAGDFVEVLQAAGWEYPNVTYRHWDRDPVGVEITLNEADGRAGRVNVAIGALINVVRKLGLTEGNTIYMNGEIPTGEALIKIGKKLQR